MTTHAMPRTKTMQAAVLKAPRTIDIQKVPIPEPGIEEVRIHIEGCGVCGSNLEPWKGRDWFQYPFAPGAPGHEGWGTIDAVGAEVTGLCTGQRVTFLSYNSFAEYDIANASAVVPLPASLIGTPVPGEPLGCVFNIFARSRIRPGDKVAVIGAGFIGLLVTRMAAKVGARVIALSRRRSALEAAKEFGASELVVLGDDDDVLAKIGTLTDGDGCDVVIEATGCQWPLDLAGEMVKTRGCLVIAGYHQNGPRQVNMQLWNWKGIDVINAHERDQDVYKQGIQEAVRAVAAGWFDPSRAYTHRFSLRDLDQAFQIMEERPEGFFKALVVND